MTSDRSGLVVKEVTSRRDLADYLTSFTAGEVSYHAMLAHYLGEEGHGRADVFQALNCASEWKPALLVEFRREQQRKARRGRGRSVYHFVISRRGRTDPKILAAMANRFLVLVGLDKQKALIAVHSDTDDNHVHIAVSALDKQGRQIILERGYSKVLLAHVNAQLCFEFGYDPEAGLGFHATGDGVYRTEDGARLRDDNFRKVTNDLRKQPALTAPSAASERETGLPSVQRQIREAVEQAMREPTLEKFSVTLAVAGITYALKGSGATISLADETFKASRIARDATPKRIAAHFGVTHLTTPEAGRLGLATGAGFYRRNDVGALQPVRLAKTQQVNRDPALPMPGADIQYRQHLAEKRLERAIPQPTLTHIDPIRDRIAMLRARPAPFRRWQAERLERALHYCTGRRGRPPRLQQALADRKLPVVDLKYDTAIILGPRQHSRWNGPPLWGDVRVKKSGALWHVTRGVQPVATFGPGMIVVHQATPADKQEITKLARLDFGSDIQAHCKPSDRRSWIRAAQAHDLVLSNSELVAAQTGLGKERESHLAKLADRLAVAGQSLMEASKEALGAATAGLKNVIPVLDRAHTRGRERAQALHQRLSVQLEVIQVASELQARHRSDVEVAKPYSPALRSDPSLEKEPAVAAPLQPPPKKPTSRKVADPATFQSANWTTTIADDGTLTWNFPLGDASAEPRAIISKPDLAAEQTPIANAPTEPGEAVPPGSPSLGPTLRQSGAGSNSQLSRTGAPPSKAENNSPSNLSAQPLRRETKFEEAIRLIQQLDAVPRIAGEFLSIRLFGAEEWKSVTIPSSTANVATAVTEGFIRRINAVEEACISGHITLNSSNHPTAHNPAIDHVIADLRRLMRDRQLSELMQNAMRGVAHPSDGGAPGAAENRRPTYATPIASLTTSRLQEALNARLSKGRSEQMNDSSAKVANQAVQSNTDLLASASAPADRYSNLMKLVARRSRQMRDWNVSDYGPLKSIDQVKQLQSQDNTQSSIITSINLGVFSNGRAV